MDSSDEPKKRRYGSILCMLLGVILLVSALVWYASNQIEARNAAQNADAALEVLLHQASCEAPVYIPQSDAPEETDAVPGEQAEAETTQETQEGYQEPEQVPSASAEHAEMPVVSYNGNDYIGYLDIPALDLELPVMSDWSYDKLNLSPCRYSGSLYDHNLVVIAHNYSQFFGNLKKLSPGDQLTFTDGDLDVYTYRVTALETLEPDDLDALEAGEWDLSLFTCTVGGKKRVVVRCTLESVI